ncbi:hypothetical protein F53441_5576 [Fusarium austroafricanum]|uniref:Uncharacterized protein n=1 Tax=Fusarium austroafricanum TaxID=2364996 RepID=A0A8H4NU99_9HYPO|nr:hypothetical protein F53441_5576 [Fusarium austroafricanum]
MAENTLHNRMTDKHVVVTIAIACVTIFLIFLAGALYCTWRDRSKARSNTRGRERGDSPTDSEVGYENIRGPDGADNGPEHEMHPLTASTRERHGHAHN